MKAAFWAAAFPDQSRHEWRDMEHRLAGRTVFRPRFGNLTTSDILLILICAGIALLRWQIISASPEPSGLDGGNWLAIGHQMLGSGWRSALALYPPVVPLLMAVLGSFWGPMLAAEALATVSSLAPSIGVYVLMRETLRVRAAILAGLLATSATVGEAAAWGGYPQLLGLGAVALLLWAVNRFVLMPDPARAFVISVFLFLALASNELVGVSALVIAGIYLVVRLRQIGPQVRSGPRLLAVSLVIATLPSALLIPVYVAIGRGYVENEATRVSNQHVDIANLFSNLNNLFKDNVGLWYVILAIAFASPLILLVKRVEARRRQRNGFGRPLAAASTAVMLAVVIGALAIGEVRLLYLLPVAMIISLGAWWTLLAQARGPIAASLDHVLVGVMALVLAVEAALLMPTFQAQVQWYTVLSPGLVSGLHDLDRVADRHAIIAVSPAANPTNQDGWPLGWWVEGLLGRPTYSASDFQWLNTRDERTRATIANDMFAPSKGIGYAIGIAQKHQIQYLVVATGWKGYQQWISGKPPPTAVSPVTQNESVLILSVRD